ncbi:MAG: aminotransferase class III-fold pyridoxal phosphate-dependent enzyme [Planctomycetes bacterium]|nr:aminotransferase class III-fold pyridoxal phosphate-dependent enzyme [Planctomycetota bacterium]
MLAASAGAYHWTPEGRKLADFTSGVLVANLGHNPVSWWRRFSRYMQWEHWSGAEPFCRTVPLTSYNGVTELEVDCSERLLANMRGQPGGGRMEQVLWAASGSEAIQKSLWASLAVKEGRDHILATRHGFHGKKGLAAAVTGSEEDEDRDARVRFIKFPIDECRDIHARRTPLDVTPYRRDLEQAAEELGDRMCCLITEPYLGGGGSYHPQPEYLQLLERFCRERDMIFILDEIQSNFGRTGPMYAYTHYGLEPDIVCLGKGMGNGVPVSAAVGRADILGTLDYGGGSDTWSANPLASAAVLATLDEFESTDVLERGAALARVLESGLDRLVGTGVVAHVRGEGCVWGVECRAVGRLSAREVAKACVETCYLGDEAGRAIHLLGPLAGTVLRVSPPLIMPTDEAREYLDVMHELFVRLRKRLEQDAV